MDQRASAALWGALSFIVTAGLAFRLLERPPAMEPEAWAAWAQAGLSAGAILAATWLQDRDRKKRSREIQANTLITALAYSRDLSDVLKLADSLKAAEGKGSTFPQFLSRELDHLERAFFSLISMQLPIAALQELISIRRTILYAQEAAHCWHLTGDLDKDEDEISGYLKSAQECQRALLNIYRVHFRNGPHQF